MLTKSIYGLNQSSKQWFYKLTIILTSKYYMQSSSDPSFFITHVKILFIYLLIYVDDLVLADNNINEINFIKSFLHQTFKIKD